jgi:hypothetical protein
MADWLDELVSRTQVQFEIQRAENAKVLEMEGRRKTLSNAFFDDLKVWLIENTALFNLKIEQEVFSIRDDRPPNTIILSSRPDLKHIWTTTITYTAHAHTIEISRSGARKVSYMLDFNPEGTEVVALGGASVMDGGLSLDLFGQEILRSMLLL